MNQNNKILIKKIIKLLRGKRTKSKIWITKSIDSSNKILNKEKILFENKK